MARVISGAHGGIRGGSRGASVRGLPSNPGAALAALRKPANGSGKTVSGLAKGTAPLQSGPPNYPTV